MKARTKRSRRKRRRDPVRRLQLGDCVLRDVAAGDTAMLEDGTNVEISFHMGADTSVYIGSRHEYMRGDTRVIDVRFRKRAEVENGQVSDPLLHKQTELPLFAHAKQNR